MSRLRLILARHGNTFGLGDNVVCVGLKSDLPLVEKGEQQARDVADFLSRENIVLNRVYCGTLKRTQQFANIILGNFCPEVEVKINPALDELDYGLWTGKSDQEIRSEFGESAFSGWAEKSQWPTNAEWGGSVEETIREVQGFADMLTMDCKSNDAADETVLAVSSNGRLRYFLTLADGEFQRRVEKAGVKVKTGRICSIVFEDGNWSVEYWNRSPVEAECEL